MNCAIISFILLALVMTFAFVKPVIVEGFESYQTCMDQGYPSDFCIQVPAQSMLHPPPERR